MSTLLEGLRYRTLEHYPGNARRILYLALAVIATITLYYESYTLASVAPLVQAQFKLSLANYVYALVLGNILGAVSAIIGSFSDRIGRGNLIVYGLLVTAICTLALSLAGVLPAFLILYWVLGFIEGIILTVTPALVRDFSPRLGRAAAMGFWTVGPVGGSVLATFVANQTLRQFARHQPVPAHLLRRRRLFRHLPLHHLQILRRRGQRHGQHLLDGQRPFRHSDRLRLRCGNGTQTLYGAW